MGTRVHVCKKYSCGNLKMSIRLWGPRIRIHGAKPRLPSSPPSSSSHAQVLLVTETDDVMGDFLWSADPAVSRGFDDHQAKCKSEVIYWCMRWWWIKDVNVFIAVTTAVFLNEEVSCPCLTGRFEYEPRDGICAQRMPHPGGQEWVRPKRRRYGDPVSSSTLWVKRQKDKQHLATPRQDRLYSALPLNWV
jgi:hypothetical protein